MFPLTPYERCDVLTPELDDDTDESPPGGIELQLPLGAVPSLPNLIPAMASGICVSAGLSAIPAGYVAITYELAGTLGRVDVEVTNWLKSLRRSPLASEVELATELQFQWRPVTGLLVGLRYADTFAFLSKNWGEANPLWRLFAKVSLQDSDWEQSLDALARLPEFSPVAMVTGRVWTAADLYRESQQAEVRLSLVRTALLHAILDVPDAMHPFELVPYLKKRVHNALPDGAISRLFVNAERGGPTRGGPTPVWFTADECRAAVVKAIRYQLVQRSAKLQGSVAAQLGFSTSGLRKNLRDFYLDWRELVQEARARR